MLVCATASAGLYRGMPNEFLGWYAQYMIEDIQAVTTGWYTEAVLSAWEATSNFVGTGERFGLVTADNPELQPLPGGIDIDEGLCEFTNGRESEGDFPDMRDPSEDISPSAGCVTFSVLYSKVNPGPVSMSYGLYTFSVVYFYLRKLY